MRQILVDFGPYPNPLSNAQASGTSPYRIPIDPITHPYPQLFRFVPQVFLDLPNLALLVMSWMGRLSPPSDLDLHLGSTEPRRIKGR